jgi:hypothetical protein
LAALPGFAGVGNFARQAVNLTLDSSNQASESVAFSTNYARRVTTAGDVHHNKHITRFKRRWIIMIAARRLRLLFPGLLIFAALAPCGLLQAKNQVLGQIQFEAADKAAKSSGVWVDGQYVGYLKELKGSKKILLLPGTHRVEVRQSGYENFTREVTLAPGQVEIVSVHMQRNPSAHYGNQTAEVKISGNPERAAVFVDGQYVGHIDQFNGPGQGMLLTPGKHHIKVSLPGYQPFETEVTLLPHQKLKLETNLLPAQALAR